MCGLESRPKYRAKFFPQGTLEHCSVIFEGVGKAPWWPVTAWEYTKATRVMLTRQTFVCPGLANDHLNHLNGSYVVSQRDVCLELVNQALDLVNDYTVTGSPTAARRWGNFYNCPQFAGADGSSWVSGSHHGVRAKRGDNYLLKLHIPVIICLEVWKGVNAGRRDYLISRVGSGPGVPAEGIFSF